MDEELKKQKLAFASVSTLRRRWKDGTFHEIIDDWKWIFSYSARYKGAVAFYVLLGVISTTLGLVSSIAGKYLIDIITGYQTDKLALLVIIMVGGMLFSLLFESIISRISAKLNIYINNDIQADIFDRIMDADWLSLSGYAGGDILNRFNNDVSTVAENAVTWLPTILIAVYRFAATFFVILHYDWVMAVIALGSAPFMLLASKFILSKQREYSRKVKEMNSKLMSFEVETFYNFDTIKSFGITGLFGQKLRAWQAKSRDIRLRYNLFTIKSNIILSCIGMAVQLVAFGYCLFRLWTHSITYGTMTLFLQQRGNLSSSFNSLVSIVPSFLNSSVSAHRIRELTELPRERRIPESDAMDKYRESGFSVEMKDLSFSYTEGREIISQSAFEAHPGEIIALVGPSGEGKTTMIRLILGLVSPRSGAVILRAGDDAEVEMNAETAHLFSYVPQGNTILSGTIAENLRMIKEDASDEEIIVALKTACAWEFVEKLPDTINSRLGERGKGVSEGQAQRLAIARAILRDAPILLLDEATSALDVATERRILKNIITQNPNKTCIVTTHRPSVLNMCTRVYRVIDTKVTQLSEDESARMAMDF